MQTNSQISFVDLSMIAASADALNSVVARSMARESIQRLSPQNGWEGGEMKADPIGSYVAFEDHMKIVNALKARISRLETKA